MNPLPASTSLQPAPTLGVQQLQAIMPRVDAVRAHLCLPYLHAAMVEANITTPPRQAAFLAQLAFESGELRFFEAPTSGEQDEGRTDLGNVRPGDGVRYKGRGPIQLTGRRNYRAAGRALGLDLEDDPSRVAELDVGLRVAAWYWNARGLNALADTGNFLELTRRLRGGIDGLDHRELYYRRALRVLAL